MDKETIDSYFFSLARVIDDIYKGEDLSNILQFICSLSSELTEAKGSMILVLERGTFNLKVLESYGLSEEYLNSEVMDYGKSVHEVEKGEVVIINDFKNNPSVKNLNEAKKEGLKAVISQPFMVNETTHSMLRVYYPAKKVPTQEEMEMLNSLGQLSCIAIQRAAVSVIMSQSNNFT